jgi:hypothetical protein
MHGYQIYHAIKYIFLSKFYIILFSSGYSHLMEYKNRSPEKKEGFLT